MSSVQFIFPKLRLAAQLKAAGGPTVADALQAAEAKLAEIAPPCLTELQMATNAALAAVQAFPAQFDRGSLDGLYAIASRAVGLGAVCGAPGADPALTSLCDLIDQFGGQGRWDLEAIKVHLRTVQLIASDAGRQMNAGAVEGLVAGLRKVSARYAEDRTARSASAG